MKKFVLMVGLLVLIAGVAGAQDEAFASGMTDGVEDLGWNVHFMGKDGTMQAGQRCASPTRSVVQADLVNRELKFMQESGALRGVEKANVSIPVAFHVLYYTRRGTSYGNIPQQWIDDQISVLNAAYAGSGFSFFLDSVDRTRSRKYYKNCYSQDTRMKRDLAIDPATTLNIYSCTPGQYLGYAYLPDAFPEDDYRHGVVLLDESLPGGSASPYNLGDTGTHEVGHYLGLDHTFANGCGSPGDSVADTPEEASAAFGCPVGRDTCPASGLDPIFNFMDYTDDSCMDEFSNGQVSRMQNLVSIYKPSLGN